MNRPFILLCLASFCIEIVACSTFTPQQGAIADDAITIAQSVGTAAAGVYGGPVGSELAGAGLSALATVLQGYVGKRVSPTIVAASPGISAVAKAVAPIVQTNHTVTQADVNTLWDAAALTGSNSVP
jgi:hypothetical protein